MPVGGAGQAGFQKALVGRLRELIVAAGLATPAEIDQHFADPADPVSPVLDLVTWPLVATLNVATLNKVAGRRPGTETVDRMVAWFYTPQWTIQSRRH